MIKLLYFHLLPSSQVCLLFRTLIIKSLCSFAAFLHSKIDVCPREGETNQGGLV